jgi:molecular chaperone DnaK (HSP70)
MKAIGIDLGTTNSCAAVFEGTHARVLPTRGGESLTPSVVGFVKRRQSHGEVVAGRIALNNAVKDPKNTVFSIKRLMGRSYGEPKVDEVARHFQFSLAPPPPEGDGSKVDHGVRVLLNGEPLTPIEVSARILRTVREDAEQALGQSVTHAVITVPAYFEERQRDATAKAGELAGLKVLKTIDEPTAAAFAFGLGRESERNRVLVYDLGGGTFDISIIQMTNGHYEVITFLGDNWLGGDDFDRKLVERIVAYTRSQYDFDPSEDLEFLIKAKLEAEKAKIALSTQQRVEIIQTFFNLGSAHDPIDLDLEVTREDFEKDITPFVDRTIDLVHQALAVQSLSPDDITQVLLVGGSTAVPLVQARVAEVFGGGKLRRDVNPMECVAIGAAILAAEFDLETERFEGERVAIREITGMDLGIAAVRGDDPDVFVPIIPRETPYPLEEPIRKVFYPSIDGQNLIRVPVYEGLSQVASANEQQGVIEFPLPDGIPTTTPVEISFNLDSRRVITVKIRILGTDLEFEERVRRDRARVRPARGIITEDWRETLQTTISATQNFTETYSEFVDPTRRAEIEEWAGRGKQALADSDAELGRSAMRELQHRLLDSGVASLLFMAERAMYGQAPEMVRALSEASSLLRLAYRRGDHAEVDRLSGSLRLAFAQVIAQRARSKPIGDAKDYDDLLRLSGPTESSR